MLRPIMLAACTLTIAAPTAAAALIPFATETTTGAFVEIPPLVNVSDSNAHDSRRVVDVLGIHAQSAGRSRLEAPQTIAANGSFVAPGFLEFDVRAAGQATQKLVLATTVGQLTMHFVLPSLLLEFSDTVERLALGGVPIGGDLFTQVQADICVKPDGGAKSCRFSLVARLEGHYGDEELGVNAMSPDPGLDLTAFDNQAPTVTGDFFKRTATWEFGTFESDLDLSAFTGGILEVTYEMLAVAEGRAAITTAAAAINDPFLFETDPTAQSPISFDFVAGEPNAVPAPGGLGLLALAFGLVAARWRPVPPPAPAGMSGPRSCRRESR
jgi:hypothetical protein